MVRLKRALVSANTAMWSWYDKEAKTTIAKKFRVGNHYHATRKQMAIS